MLHLRNQQLWKGRHGRRASWHEWPAAVPWRRDSSKGRVGRPRLRTPQAASLIAASPQPSCLGRPEPRRRCAKTEARRSACAAPAYTCKGTLAQLSHRPERGVWCRAGGGAGEQRCCRRRYRPPCKSSSDTCLPLHPPAGLMLPAIKTDVCIVGGGPAGLSTAHAILRARWAAPLVLRPDAVAAAAAGAGSWV